VIVADLLFDRVAKRGQELVHGAMVFVEVLPQGPTGLNLHDQNWFVLFQGLDAAVQHRQFESLHIDLDQVNLFELEAIQRSALDLGAARTKGNLTVTCVSILDI
jgi:hypothetical protein